MIWTGAFAQPEEMQKPADFKESPFQDAPKSVETEPQVIRLS